MLVYVLPSAGRTAERLPSGEPSVWEVYEVLGMKSSVEHGLYGVVHLGLVEGLVALYDVVVAVS